MVLATMASRSKEESQADPLEDFVEFCRGHEKYWIRSTDSLEPMSKCPR